MRILMDSLYTFFLRFHCFKHEIYDAIIKIKREHWEGPFTKLNKLRQNAIKFDLVPNMNESEGFKHIREGGEKSS